MPDGPSTLDVLIICLGLAVLLGGALFGAGHARSARVAPGNPGTLTPWLVGGASVLLLLGGLAYFVFAGS